MANMKVATKGGHQKVPTKRAAWLNDKGVVSFGYGAPGEVEISLEDAKAILHGEKTAEDVRG